MYSTSYFSKQNSPHAAQLLNSNFILFKEGLISIKNRIELDKLEPTEFYYEDARLIDKNFIDCQLLPGEYKIKSFRIPNGASFKECIQFVKNENCLLVGPYAIAAAYINSNEFLPTNTYTVSIGKITGDSHLDKIQSYLDHRLKDQEHIWRFDIGDFSRGIPLNYYLLCLYNKK